MAPPKSQTPSAAPAVELTAAEAAKRVTRPVPEIGEDGKATGETREVKVEADEVMAWAVRGERVIVVTTDGQKLEGKL